MGDQREWELAASAGHGLAARCPSRPRGMDSGRKTFHLWVEHRPREQHLRTRRAALVRILEETDGRAFDDGPVGCAGCDSDPRWHGAVCRRRDRAGRDARIRSTTEAVCAVPEWFGGLVFRRLTGQEMDGLYGVS